MLAEGTKSVTAWLGNGLRRLAFQRSVGHRDCSHPADMRPAPEGPLVCPGCERDGSTWVKVRMCLACGTVGCCDSSSGQHARRHHEETGHPVIRSIEAGEAWAWCYVDQAYLAPARGEPAVR